MIVDWFKLLLAREKQLACSADSCAVCAVSIVECPPSWPAYVVVTMIIPIATWSSVQDFILQTMERHAVFQL